MKKPNNKGPAFPKRSMTKLKDRGSAWGMSLRDYFAAMAMPVAAAPLADGSQCNDVKILAKWAYQYADAMLVERTENEAE